MLMYPMFGIVIGYPILCDHIGVLVVLVTHGYFLTHGVMHCLSS